MTDRRYDGAFAPTAAQFVALYHDALAQGAEPQFAGYVGGPRVYHAWSAQDFANGRAAGFDMSGVYVGLQAADFASLTMSAAEAAGTRDGLEAVRQAQGVGLAAGSRLALDVEAGASGANAVVYAQAWARAVRAAGFRAELYGLPSFVEAAGQAFDAVWAATYVTQDPGSTTAPGVGVDAGHRAWQWRNSHTEEGAGIDTSDADQDPQEIARMLSDQDIARGIIYSLRAALLGEDAGTPQPGGQGEASAVEAYVGSLTTGNIEGGLSALIADCKRDGRYMPGRVAALEAWASAQRAEAAAPAPTVDLAPLSTRVAALEAFRAAVKGA